LNAVRYGIPLRARLARGLNESRTDPGEGGPERVAGRIEVQGRVCGIEPGTDLVGHVGNGFGPGGFGNCDAGVFQNP
jgi:hypothetical protein